MMVKSKMLAICCLRADNRNYCCSELWALYINNYYVFW